MEVNCEKFFLVGIGLYLGYAGIRSVLAPHKTKEEPFLAKGVRVCIPEPYQETVYRPGTIDASVDSLTRRMIDPFITKLDTNYQFAEWIHITVREHQTATLYYIKALVRNTSTHTTHQLDIEVMLTRDGQTYMNYVYVDEMDVKIPINDMEATKKAGDLRDTLLPGGFQYVKETPNGVGHRSKVEF